MNADTETKNKMSVKSRLFVTSAFVALMSLISGVSAAFSMNSTELIIGQVALLFVPLLAVIMAAIPVMIVMAIIAFIIGLLSVILQKINL